MTDDRKVLNDENRMQHPCDIRQEELLLSLQEIRSDVARISQRLTSRFPILSHGPRDAYTQVPRRLLSAIADCPPLLEVVFAHFIPQRLKEDIAFFQIVTMRYLRACGAEPMLAKKSGHLYAEHHGFLNRRASKHLVAPANIDGDVFWVPDPTNHQIWPALVLDASEKTPADLRSRIEPQMKGQFTVEGFGSQCVLCFETKRDFMIAKLYLG